MVVRRGSFKTLHVQKHGTEIIEGFFFFKGSLGSRKLFIVVFLSGFNSFYVVWFNYFAIFINFSVLIFVVLENSAIWFINFWYWSWSSVVVADRESSAVAADVKKAFRSFRCHPSFSWKRARNRSRLTPFLETGSVLVLAGAWRGLRGRCWRWRLRQMPGQREQDRMAAAECWRDAAEKRAWL